MTIYKYEMSVCNCGMSRDQWLCMVRDMLSEANILLFHSARVDPPAADGHDVTAADNWLGLRSAVANLMTSHADDSSGIHLLGVALSLSSHKMAAGLLLLQVSPRS